MALAPSKECMVYNTVEPRNPGNTNSEGKRKTVQVSEGVELSG